MATAVSSEGKRKEKTIVTLGKVHYELVPLQEGFDMSKYEVSGGVMTKFFVSILTKKGEQKKNV